MKTLLLILITIILSGCGGGGSSTTTPPAPPAAANLSGVWSGSFPVYSCDVTLTTSDNANYTGHITVKQKPVLNIVPEWFTADISGKIGAAATTSNTTSTYALNGGVASIFLIADNYLTPTKIGCMASIHYGTEGFDTNINGNEWLTKQ
jgi:hypothetical protein